MALYDGDAEITADNIKVLLDASNNVVQPYWPALFAGALQNGGVEKMLYTVGGGAAPAPVAVAAGGDAPAAVVEVAKPKEEEVDPMDGGMDMFGGGGGGDY